MRKKIFLCIFLIGMMLSFAGCSVDISEDDVKGFLSDFDKVLQGIQDEMSDEAEESIDKTDDIVEGNILISYDARGGEFTNADDSHSPTLEQPLGTARRLTTEIPSYKGKHFLGWSEEYDPETGEVGVPQYQSGDKFWAVTETRLYAVWMDHEDFLISLGDKEKENEVEKYGLKDHTMVEVVDEVILCSCGAKIDDPDSNADGISDYCTLALSYTNLVKEDIQPFTTAVDESLIDQNPDIPFSQIRFLTIQENADLDEDGAKNGEEVIVTLLKDYTVSVEIISDPTWKEPDIPYYEVDLADYNILVSDNYTASLFLEDIGWFENVKLWLTRDKEAFAKQQIAESLAEYIDIAYKKRICENKIEFMTEVSNQTSKNIVKMMGTAWGTFDKSLDAQGIPLLEACTEYINEMNKLDLKLYDLQIELGKGFNIQTYNKINAVEKEMGNLMEEFSEKMQKLQKDGNFTEDGMIDYIKCFNINLDERVFKVAKGASTVVKVGTWTINVLKTLEEWTRDSTLYAQLNATIDLYDEVSAVLDELSTNCEIDFVKNAAKSLQQDWTNQMVIISEGVSTAWRQFDDVAVEAALSLMIKDISPFVFAIQTGATIGEGITNKNAVEKYKVRTITAAATSEVCLELLQKQVIAKANKVVYLKEKTEETEEEVIDAMALMRLLIHLRLQGEEEALKTNDADRKNLISKVIGMNNDLLEDNTKDHITKLEDIAEKYFKEYEMVLEE